MDAEEFLRLATRHDVLTPAVIDWVRERLGGSPHPISARTVARALQDKGHLNRQVAQWLLDHRGADGRPPGEMPEAPSGQIPSTVASDTVAPDDPLPTTSVDLEPLEPIAPMSLLDDLPAAGERPILDQPVSARPRAQSLRTIVLGLLVGAVAAIALWLAMRR